MRKLILVMLVLMFLSVTTGCLNLSGNKSPTGSALQIAIAEAELPEQQMIAARSALIDSALSEITCLSTEITEYLTTGVSDGAAEFIGNVQAALVPIVDKLGELKKFAALQLELKGNPAYVADISTENLAAMRQNYRERILVLEQEKNALLARLQETGSTKSGFLSKMSGWTRFALLGILVVGYILGVMFVKIRFGSAISTVASIAGAAIIAMYTWFSYKDIIVQAASIGIGLALIGGLGYLVVVLLRYKNTVVSIEKAKQGDNSVEKTVVVDFAEVSNNMSAGTKAFVKVLKGDVLPGSGVGTPK